GREADAGRAPQGEGRGLLRCPRGDGARRGDPARLRAVGHDQPRLVTGEDGSDQGSLEELMAGFRATPHGVTARFGAAQATIIRDRVGQIAELISEEGPGGAGGPGAGEPGWPDNGPAGPDDLAAMIGLTDHTKLPEDPVLARLLPDAYRDDPEASGEF